MKNPPIPLTLAVLSLSVLISGCGGVTQKASEAASFLAGAYVVVVPSPIVDVCWASQTALKNLKIETSAEHCDNLVGTIKAKTAHNKKITLSLRATPENHTRLSIHIGTLGDRELSKIIYLKIKHYLHTAG